MFLLLLFVLFSLVSAIWMAFRTNVYEQYGRGMEQFAEDDRKRYVDEDSEGYLYNLKLPDFLQTDCNACISNEEEGISLFIWPKISGRTEYGMQLSHPEGGELNIELCMMIDEEGNALEEMGEKEKRKFESQKEEIQVLLEKAEKRWGIHD